MNEISIAFRHGKVSPDLVADHALWRQFTREAGLQGALYIAETDFDKVSLAAGKHGFGFVFEHRHLAQHGETGRILEWPAQKPLPSGYAWVSSNKSETLQSHND